MRTTFYESLLSYLNHNDNTEATELTTREKLLLDTLILDTDIKSKMGLLGSNDSLVTYSAAKCPEMNKFLNSDEDSVITTSTAIYNTYTSRLRYDHSNLNDEVLKLVEFIGELPARTHLRIVME